MKTAIISPKANGTIPDAQQQVLLALGKWLGVNHGAEIATSLRIRPSASCGDIHCAGRRNSAVTTGNIST